LQFNFLIINPSSDGPLYNTESLKTGAGVGITSFAKFTTFGKDLYADLVAPGLRTSLLGMSSLLCLLFFALPFSTTFGKDLYADLVAPGLRTSLLGMSSFLSFCFFLLALSS
jgi:hypothetical protein